MSSRFQSKFVEVREAFFPYVAIRLRRSAAVEDEDMALAIGVLKSL
jgi:hypothetical protein